MKKVYEKPQFVFESFEMSTNIAAGCAYTNVTFSKDTCGYHVSERFGDFVLFLESSICETTADDGTYDKMCYHVPTEGNSIFNS